MNVFYFLLFRGLVQGKQPKLHVAASNMCHIVDHSAKWKTNVTFAVSLSKAGQGELPAWSLEDAPVLLVCPITCEHLKIGRSCINASNSLMV